MVIFLKYSREYLSNRVGNILKKSFEGVLFLLKIQTPLQVFLKDFTKLKLP